MSRALCSTAAAVAVCAIVFGASNDAAVRVDPLEQVETERDAAYAELTRLERLQLRMPNDTRLFTDAARMAWSQVDRHYFTGTGLTAPVRDYSIATIWDIGSTLAALYCANALGLVDAGDYEARTLRILRTLSRIPLHGDSVFNRAYDAKTGAMMVHRQGASQFVGWSSTDLGRLLIWLKIVAIDPRFTQAAEAVVKRNDFNRVVRDGYLWGADVDQFGKIHTYQEGRIGYEQYAAQGFALWGFRGEKALSLTENALPLTIMGQEVVADVRRWDRLNTEPFLLLGLEIGWDRSTAALVRRLVRTQEQRYRNTGEVTMTGEDAIARPPHYFYYYCVWANGKQFGVDVQDRQDAADGPRWVSAKSALALHALMPTRYSQLALEKVRAARGPRGWASGVYEVSGTSTGTENINTAAVILSAALVHLQGEPILTGAQHRAALTGDK